MATRRPNVPRVSPAARTPAALKDPGQGAEVIRGNFRPGGHGAAGKTGYPATPLPPADSDGTDRTGTSRAGNRQPDPARKASQPGPPRTNPAQPGPGASGGAARGHGSKENQGSSGDAQGQNPPPAGAGALGDPGPVPAKAFSGRMLALLVVMIAITVMLAPTVKIFIDKSAEIAELNADIADKRAEQAALNQQVSRWQDPNYVKQQARDRINMVMPGETSYWVFGSDVPADTLPAEPDAAGAAAVEDLPWVDALWESVRRSGNG